MSSPEITRMTNRPPLPPYFWMSFVDRIDGDGDVTIHLGIAIVEAHDIEDAAQVAWERECNPGGGILGHPLTGIRDLPSHLTYRLLDQPSDIAEAQMAVTRASDGIGHGDAQHSLPRALPRGESAAWRSRCTARRTCHSADRPGRPAVALWLHWVRQGRHRYHQTARRYIRRVRHHSLRQARRSDVRSGSGSGEIATRVT